MLSIRYNQNIKKIGLEIEGFYKKELLDECEEHVKNFDMLLTMKMDGSLNNTFSGYYSQEITTIPTRTGRELTQILEFMSKAQKQKDYKLNPSVGLHFHISLMNGAYSAICNPDFFIDYIKMFETTFPEIWSARNNNRYAKADLSDIYGSDRKIWKKHFTRGSEIRYAFVNYCYDKHRTVEFRAYGGEFATFEGLAVCIQKTINLIGKYANKTQSVVKTINDNFIKKEPEVLTLDIKKRPTNLNTITIEDRSYSEIDNVFNIDIPVQREIIINL